MCYIRQLFISCLNAFDYQTRFIACWHKQTVSEKMFIEKPLSHGLHQVNWLQCEMCGLACMISCHSVCHAQFIILQEDLWKDTWTSQPLLGMPHRAKISSNHHAFPVLYIIIINFSAEFTAGSRGFFTVVQFGCGSSSLIVPMVSVFAMFSVWLLFGHMQCR